MLFWWVVLAPPPRFLRSSTSDILLMLFATWMVSDLLGATLSLASDVLYPGYADPAFVSPCCGGRSALGRDLDAGRGGTLYAACMLAILVGPYLPAHSIRPADTRP